MFKSSLKLLQSSYQSGKYLPLEKFKSPETYRESLTDFGKIHSSKQPVYIVKLRELHYKRASSCIKERESSIFECSNPLVLQYPFEFYEFLSEDWTNLGCEGVFYPYGFKIPFTGKSLDVGLIESTFLYILNHHDFLKPFLSAPNSHISRTDNINHFITTYAFAFFVSVILDIFLNEVLKLNKLSILGVYIITAPGITAISKKVARTIFAYVIRINRYYRLKKGSHFASIAALFLLLGCFVFCSVTLVLACMFSVDNSYSRVDMILRYALQVHFVTAVEELLFIALLYISWYHLNVSLLNGKFRLATVGALFCELLVENGTEYYHYQKSIGNGLIIIDYVVTMDYAEQNNWIKTELKVTNPMVDVTLLSSDKNSEIHRISIVTKANASPEMMISSQNILRIDDFDRMSMVTSSTDAVVSKRIDILEVESKFT